MNAILTTTVNCGHSVTLYRYFYGFISVDFRVIDDACFSACSTFGHFFSASLTGGFDMEHMVS